MSFIFSRVSRPPPVVPDTTLDEELGKAAQDAELTLYFINMTVVSASNLINTDMALVDKSDPYCEVHVGNLVHRTPTIQNDLNPVWNEKMNFFVPDKPDKMVLRLMDENVNQKDDFLGEAEFEFGSLFEIGGTFEGDLKLEKVKKGSVRFALRCRMMKPIETEIKLGYVEKQLEGKGKDYEATVAALDESEKLREDAINELSAKEQEIIKRADELAEKQKLHQNELTEKEKKILDQAQMIEVKIQDYEEAQVALREAELKKKEVESKLTKAEKEILRKAEELEVKERENAEALTAKEKEILATAEKLEAKELAQKEIQKKLEQTEALKMEVENELTAKERIIQEQAKQIESKGKQDAEALSKKEQEILEASKALAKREAAAREAQRKQDTTQAELDAVKKEKEGLKREIQQIKQERDKLGLKSRKLASDADAALAEAKRQHEQKQAEVDSLHKTKAGLENELRKTKAELQTLREEEAKAKAKMCNSGCSLM